jgi:hypothetical protein
MSKATHISGGEQSQGERRDNKTVRRPGCEDTQPENKKKKEEDYTKTTNSHQQGATYSSASAEFSHSHDRHVQPSLVAGAASDSAPGWASELSGVD